MIILIDVSGYFSRSTVKLPCYLENLNSTFSNRSSFHQNDGCVDEKLITLKFADHFVKICSNNNNSRNTGLPVEFTNLRSGYVGSPLIQDMVLRLS